MQEQRREDATANLEKIYLLTDARKDSRRAALIEKKQGMCSKPMTTLQNKEAAVWPQAVPSKKGETRL